MIYVMMPIEKVNLTYELIRNIPYRWSPSLENRVEELYLSTKKFARMAQTQ
jgi:hypothetical protein